MLRPECVVERLEQLDLLLLVRQQVLLPVAVAPAPQHVLVHLLRVAALVLQTRCQLLFCVASIKLTLMCSSSLSSMELLASVAGRRMFEGCEAVLVDDEVDEEGIVKREVVSGRWFEVIVKGRCAT